MEEIWSPEQKTHILKRIRECFANDKIEWIAHNLSFDHKYVLTKEMDIAGKVHDTMLLQQLLDENAHDLKGLKALAAVHTDMGKYDDVLDEFIQELKTSKSKALTEQKRRVKKLIKIKWNKITA